MTFRTEFNIPESPTKISSSTSILTMGSCFADVVGNQLKNSQLDVLVNPFGTLFNPLAMAKVLSLSLKNEAIDTELFLQNNEHWFHYDFHSSFSGKTKEEIGDTIQNGRLQVNEILKSKAQTSNFLLLTFGTAFAYQHLESKKYIANCHKMPSSLFKKELLSVKHICQNFGLLYKQLKAKNENLHIILTVSPVRHTKDGIPENQVSKSILRAACHYLVADYEGVSYFPSYEIMMDELRDYRFYAQDMLHLSQTAIDYIWIRFFENYISEENYRTMEDICSIQKSLLHRSFHLDSESHKKFLVALNQKIIKMQKQFPHFKF